MDYVILVFSVFMLVAGAVILVKPAAVFGLMSAHSQSLELHIFAVVARLVLGVALIVSAQNSKFPLALQIIGWISIAAAIILSLIGRSRFKRLMEWAMTVAPKYGRVAGIFVMLFGGFLGYSVL